jgi:hypothetical protein
MKTTTKPTCKLIGSDSNVFAIIGKVTRAQTVRTYYAGTSATVDVRAHTAELSCSCADPTWLVVRVQLALPEMDLTVRRQYAL